MAAPKLTDPGAAAKVAALVAEALKRAAQRRGELRRAA